jgi:nucleotide-binding universal stress UspA family protein
MVPEIKKILFATDLSKNSRHAFNYAVSAADRYGATITILHVMEEVSPSANVHLKNFSGEAKYLSYWSACPMTNRVCDKQRLTSNSL